MNTDPGNCAFSVMLYIVPRKRHCFGLLYLWHSSTNFNIFLDNKVVLLSTVCKYYFSPSHFVFETRYAPWLKKTELPGFILPPGSAESLVRRGGTTNQILIAYSLRNISAKNTQNRLISVAVIVCYISVVVLETRCSMSGTIEWVSVWSCVQSITWQTDRWQLPSATCQRLRPGRTQLSGHSHLLPQLLFTLLRLLRLLPSNAWTSVIAQRCQRAASVTA